MFSHTGSSTGAKQKEISDLPVEILLTIFKYLSTEERKAVKLSCKFWFEFCNVFSLLNDEVLNCLGIYQLSNIYELLEKSERGFLNLKFQNMNFLETSSFWQNIGPKIRSISFIDCQFGNNNFAEMTNFCENLVHLSFIRTSRYGNSRSLPLRIIPIRGLRNEIVRENLNSLEIDIPDSYSISNYIIHQLFSIFPKIKILKISCRLMHKSFEEIYMDLSELTSRIYFTFSPILNYLVKSTNQIEKLKLDFPLCNFSKNSLHSIFETLTAMTRLTELSITVGGTVQLEDLETFLHSKKLRSLEYRLTMNENLLQLLLSNPCLQFLEIHFPNSFIVTKPFLEKLMSSSLKSLKVNEAVFLRDTDASRSCFSNKNKPTALRNLSVTQTGTWRRNPSDLCLFLRYFRNLHHLELLDSSCCGLQSILNHQNELKSFILREQIRKSGNCLNPEHPFGSSYPFNRLKNIEYLELSYSATYVFLRSLRPKLIFANLKYLNCIDTRGHQNMPFALSMDDLLISADAMPFLEGLRVCCCITFDFCVKLCTKLNRLRYLNSSRECLVDLHLGPCKIEHFQELFTICPSLRVLVHHFPYNKRYSYFLETLEKKVLVRRKHLDSDDSDYTFCKPRIGEFTVNWLEF